MTHTRNLLIDFYFFNFYKLTIVSISDGDESIRSPILESILDSSRNSNNEDQGNLLKCIIDNKTVGR